MDSLYVLSLKNSNGPPYGAIIMNMSMPDFRLGNGSSEIERGEKLRLATSFIVRILIPAVSALEEGETLNSDTLDILLKNFQIANEGLGDDLEMSHVVTRAFEITLSSRETFAKVEKTIPNFKKCLDRAVDILNDYRPQTAT